MRRNGPAAGGAGIFATYPAFDGLIGNFFSEFLGTAVLLFGVRAITQAAALELREQGIQVALLIVDAGIEPLSGSARAGSAPETLADPRQLADAVVFLAAQGSRAATHELQLTPLAETWVP